MKTIYFDEAGFTGSDLTNESQPYFTVGSACFSDAEIQQLESDLQLAGKKELHFNELYQKKSGQNKIIRVLSHPLIDADHIKFGVADKRYCIYAQMVDTIIETYVYSLNDNLYKNRGNLIMAFCLYTFAVNHPEQAFVKDFEKAFVQMIRKQDEDSVAEFYLTVAFLQSLPDTNESFKELLNLILATQATAKDSFTDDPFYLDNTLSIFVDLINDWYRTTGAKSDVKFDNSEPMRTRADMIEKLKNLKTEPKVVGPKGREHVYPLPVGDFQLVDSVDYLGVQIADLIASAFNFLHLNKNPKYDDFRVRLSALSVLKTPSSTLFPATEEFIHDAMKSPYDGSPVDDLASMLGDDEYDNE